MTLHIKLSTEAVKLVPSETPEHRNGSIRYLTEHFYSMKTHPKMWKEASGNLPGFFANLAYDKLEKMKEEYPGCEIKIHVFGGRGRKKRQKWEDWGSVCYPDTSS